MHESIGRVVNQVIKEFIEHPPRLKMSETQTYMYVFSNHLKSSLYPVPLHRPPSDTTHTNTLNWNSHSSQPVHDHYDYHHDHAITNSTTSSQVTLL